MKGKIIWLPKCDIAFHNLKSHLDFLPLLTSPKLEEELFLYITAFEEAVNVVLICKREQEQASIYYH